FVALSEDLLPRILKDRPGSGPINIWCGGCSSGQEPYSILMALSERLSASEIERINITATDISSEILTKAKSGTYTNLEIQRGLPITHLVKYFSDNSNESWTVKKEIRDRISFSEFNLLTGTFPRGKYDIIFCRNVIIYQNRENKNKILSSLFESLTPDGNLFLGSGESLIGTDISYLQENLQGSMTFKKKHKQAA
ncbi:MAG: protein-glutamate O-methyltransferase CheR, partial [Halobacteriovoraceae bacterium]|nr:protein-glutamate O-methyltransferase CheR [Halobacteriovoraceae bacterium]